MVNNMRLTIVAGLMMGVLLAIQSAHAAHANVKVGVASASLVHVIAPWYIAMNAGIVPSPV